jgi:hypothetical protein
MGEENEGDEQEGIWLIEFTHVQNRAIKLLATALSGTEKG